MIIFDSMHGSLTLSFLLYIHVLDMRECLTGIVPQIYEMPWFAHNKQSGNLSLSPLAGSIALLNYNCHNELQLPSSLIILNHAVYNYILAISTR